MIKQSTDVVHKTGLTTSIVLFQGSITLNLIVTSWIGLLAVLYKAV